MSSPLKHVKVVPIAAESFGVRSMCTYIETPDVKLLIDPGVSLGMRFSLLPHPREYRAIKECRERIANYAQRAEIVTISHYHFDHFTPSYTDYVWNWSSLEVAQQIYKDKLILAKEIRRMINPSQRRRGWMLRKTMKNSIKKVEDADGRSFNYGKTTLRFSNPVFHGEEDTPLGWVLMLTVEYGDEKILYAPDIQGPMIPLTLNQIIESRPNLTIVGGPPLYLSGFRVEEAKISRGLESLVSLAKSMPLTILDHHLLRDENWLRFSKPVFDTAAENGNKVFTMAEFAGEKNRLLEFRRRVLYEEEHPSDEFIRWSKLPRMRQREVTPLV